MRRAVAKNDSINKTDKIDNDDSINTIALDKEGRSKLYTALQDLETPKQPDCVPSTSMPLIWLCTLVYDKRRAQRVAQQEREKAIDRLHALAYSSRPENIPDPAAGSLGRQEHRRFQRLDSGLSKGSQ